MIQRKKDDTPTIAKIAFALGLGIVSFIFLVVVLSSISFIFHGSISVLWSIFALIGSLGITYWKLQRDKVVKPYIWIIALFAIFAGSIAISSQTFDTTWDGNDYHKTAIGEMRDGWNPVWENMLDFHNSSRNPLYNENAEGEFRDYLTNWTNHYTKTTWIFAANTYAVTGNIESGKSITILSILVLFFFALSFFYPILGRNKSLILASILALNPVVVAQLFNYYNDGVLGNLLMTLILLLTMLISRHKIYRKQQRILLVLIVMVIAVLVNVKFSALAYAGIVALCYYAYILIRRDWKLAGRLTITGITSLAIGLLVIGATSYIPNTVNKGHPLFPLAGEGKIDIMEIQQPVGYAEQSGIRKFVANNLYATTNLSYNPEATETPHLKIPFTISIGELSTLSSTSDARQAGYGVWFGGILIISAVLGAYLLIRYGRKYKEYLPAILLPLATIAVTIVVFDNTWWARYLPQLIILPVLVIFALFITKAKVLPYILSFALFFNVILSGLLSLQYQASFIKYSKGQLSHIVCDENTPITIGYGRFYGSVYNVRDLCSNIAITHKEPSEIPEDKIIQLYYGAYMVKE